MTNYKLQNMKSKTKITNKGKRKKQRNLMSEQSSYLKQKQTEKAGLTETATATDPTTNNKDKQTHE
jgi:hypothetical protein